MLPRTPRDVRRGAAGVISRGQRITHRRRNADLCQPVACAWAREYTGVRLFCADEHPSPLVRTARRPVACTDHDEVAARHRPAGITGRVHSDAPARAPQGPWVHLECGQMPLRQPSSLQLRQPSSLQFLARARCISRGSRPPCVPCRLPGKRMCSPLAQVGAYRHRYRSGRQACVTSKRRTSRAMPGLALRHWLPPACVALMRCLGAVCHAGRW